MSTNMTLPIDFQKDRNGNGKYNPFKKEEKEVLTMEVDESLMTALNNLDKSNIRTKFKQASDPVYLAFKHLDNKPLAILAREFIKDSADDFIEMICKLFA